MFSVIGELHAPKVACPSSVTCQSGCLWEQRLSLRPLSGHVSLAATIRCHPRHHAYVETAEKPVCGPQAPFPAAEGQMSRRRRLSSCSCGTWAVGRRIGPCVSCIGCRLPQVGRAWSRPAVPRPLLLCPSQSRRHSGERWMPKGSENIRGQGSGEPLAFLAARACVQDAVVCQCREDPQPKRGPEPQVTTSGQAALLTPNECRLMLHLGEVRGQWLVPHGASVETGVCGAAGLM